MRTRATSSAWTLAIVIAVMALVAACGPGDEAGGDGGAANTPSADGDETAAADADDGSADDGETYEWDYLLYLPLTHQVSEWAQVFADDVAERTNGRLQITLRPAGELPYTPDEANRRAGDGRVQLADALGVFISGDCTEVNVMTLPFLLRSPDDVSEVWDIMEDPLTEECFQPYGTQILYTWNWPAPIYWGVGEPVATLDDFQGRRVRQSSPTEGSFVSAIGAQTETIPTSEVPGAVERNVVEVINTTGLNMVGSQWGDFIDWAYELEAAGISTNYVVVGQDAYDSLPADLQEALTAAAEAAHERSTTDFQQAEAEARETLVSEFGIEFYPARDEDVQRAREIMEPIWEEWAAGNENALNLIQQIRDRLGT